MPRETLSQEVIWIPESRRVPMPGAVRTGANTRVWTLFTHTDPNVKPELPIVPKHHENAFLEDYVHDWGHARGEFSYYSRAVESGVWVLIENLKPEDRSKKR